MTSDIINSESLNKVQLPALVVGIAATAMCAVGAIFGVAQVLHSYLLALLFWWGITIGCLGLTILNHLVGGRWGYRTRPIFTAGISTLPLLALLFAPIGLGLEHIYEWADADKVAHDPLLLHKSAYLDPSFFRCRAAGYFVIWILLGWLFSGRRVSRASERARNHRGGVSGISLILVVVSVSFAAIDWAMSLEPHWFSTIYGALVAMGGVLTAMALVAGVVALGGAGSLEEESNLQVLHDVGSLLMAFLMLWAYFAFSQFLIIWAGNLPDEIRWYVHRLNGGWQWIALLIVVFHFVVPFIWLLSSERKRNAQAMLAVAGLILVIHYVELFWNVAPAFNHERFSLSWLDLVAPLAVGGFWIALFVWQLKKRLALTEA